MSRVTCVHRIRQPGAVVSQVALDAATGVAAVSQVELDAAGVAVSRVALNQNKYGMVRSSPPPGELSTPSQDAISLHLLQFSNSPNNSSFLSIP